MSLPAFRTDPQRTRLITWWSCLIAYFVILVGVPLVAGGIQTLAVATLNDTGITRTPIGPVLQWMEQLVTMLAYSFVAAWMGAVASLPVVIWAWFKGWFGWATAALTGILVEVLVLGFLFQMPPAEIFGFLMLPSALLGLGFWVTVRLIHPDAFGPDPQG